MPLSPFLFGNLQIADSGETELALPYLPPSIIISDNEIGGVGFTVPQAFGMSFEMPSGGTTNDVSQLSFKWVRRNNVTPPPEGDIEVSLYTAVWYPDDGLDNIDEGWVPDTLLATSGVIDSAVFIPEGGLPVWNEIPLTSTVTLTPGTRYIQTWDMRNMSGLSGTSPLLISGWTTRDTETPLQNACNYAELGHPSAPLWRPSTSDSSINRAYYNTRVIVDP